MNFTIRPAKLKDVDAIVPLIKMASGGITEFLLGDLVQDVSEDTFIEIALMDENTTYHYHYMMVVEYENKIIAASNYYPAELHALSDVMRSFVSCEKLKVIEPYLNSRIKDSMYINTLAVAPEYRHTTCGFLLGKKIESIAKEKNKRCLSAHVWVENTALYEAMKMGQYQSIEHLDIEHPNLPYKGGMDLLKGPDFAGFKPS